MKVFDFLRLDLSREFSHRGLGHLRVFCEPFVMVIYLALPPLAGRELSGLVLWALTPNSKLIAIYSLWYSSVCCGNMAELIIMDGK